MASSAPTPTPTLDDLWASDRARVSVVVAATPKPGVDFATARDALLAVRWDERSLEWHSTRRGPRDSAAAAAPDDDDAFVVEAVGSCLASGGDESSVAPRVAALAAARFDDAELVVSAPCHVPFLEVRDGVDDPRVRVAAAALLEKEESQGDDARARAVAAFAELGLAASRRRCVASEDLARLTRAATRRMAAAERAMATRHGSVRFGEDAFAFREMGSRGGQRFDLLFPREGEEEEEGGGGEGAGEGGGESPQGTAFTTRTGSYGNQSGLERDERDGGDGGEGDAAFVRAFARRAPWVRALVDPILSPPPLSSSSSSSANSASPRRTWWCDVSIVYSKPGGARAGLALRRAAPRGRRAREPRRRRRVAPVRDLRLRASRGLERRGRVHAVLGGVAQGGRAHRVRVRGGGVARRRRRERRVLFSHWFPYDPVRVVNAVP